jgi:hypothetical protein
MSPALRNQRSNLMPLRPIHAIMRHRVRPAAERTDRSLHRPARSTTIETAHRQPSLPDGPRPQALQIQSLATKTSQQASASLRFANAQVAALTAHLEAHRKATTR